jgi:hypothetical protein
LGRAPLPRFLGYPALIGRAYFVNPVGHFALDIASKERESVCLITDPEPHQLAPVTPASASGPPRGWGGDGAMLRLSRVTGGFQRG